MALTRRELLRSGAAGYAGLSLAGVLAACGSSEQGSKGRAIVVGAGLAGLSAADELAGRGWEVVVAEARDRVGGRVWTLRDPASGQHAEGGGEFLDSEHSRMRDLVSRFGLELELSYDEDADGEDIVVRNGARHSYSEFADEDAREQMGRYHGAIDELAAGMDPADPASHPEAAELDSATAAEGLDELGIRGHARYLLESLFRDDYGVEPDVLSQLFVVHTYAAAYNQPDSGAELYRIKGGNDQVPKGLAAELEDAGVPIRLGEPVTAVEHDSGGVSVSVRGGARLQGDYCVLAAPLPALRRIRFTPRLPEPLALAVAGAQYGLISKTLLQYPRRFWRRRGLSGNAITDLAAGSTWEATVQQDGGPGVLIAYAAGDLGSELLELSDVEVTGAVSAGVAEAFPGPVPAPVEARPVRWPLEPYSGGGYVAWAPGQMSVSYGPLREGSGRLLFAGEHTAELSGYMEGAVRSGIRAAEQIDAS